MADKQLKQNQQPEIASSFHAEFFVMPEAYRHGKEVMMAEPKQEAKKPLIQAPPVPVPPPTAPKQQLTQPAQKKSSTTKALLIAGGILLIALGIGGYLVMRSLQKQPVVEVPIVSPPREAPVTEPIPPVEPEPTPIEPDLVAPREVIPGRDIDSDGLSDTEEQLVYGSNANLPDTDADGFLDGNEVFHQYNPNGNAPGTLVGSGLVLEQIEDAMKLVYPSIWTVGRRTNDDQPTFSSGLLFVTTTGEQMRLDFSTPDLNAEELLTTWKEQFVQTPISSNSKTGYRLFVTTDNLQAFLIIGTRAIKFAYDPGLKSTVEYLQTFQMMINSVAQITPEL